VQWLTDNRPDSIDVYVGLTNKDISITKYKGPSGEIKEPTWQYRDFGIYGLGRVGGKACVVSSNRLRKNGTGAQFYQRLCRIACHEVGHVLGLHHCSQKACLMNDANEKITTIDKSTGNLCEKCWSKID
jgi:archaemetzincin